MLDERLQFGARHRFVDDLLPAIIIHLRKLTQLVEDGPSLCLRKLRQFVDDLVCRLLLEKKKKTNILLHLETKYWVIASEAHIGCQPDADSKTKKSPIV